MPPDPPQLDRLSIHPYRVAFVAEERVSAPETRLPNMLRGTFEISFRRLVCHDVTLDCRQCPLVEACPYPALFRPTPPAGSDRLSRAQDLPRPFLFEVAPGTQPQLAPGDPLAIGLTLFGTANRLLPYFIVALRALAERGLGATRGRLRIASVTASTPDGVREVFDEARNVVTPPKEGLRLTQLSRPDDADVRRARVRFLTPTTLKRHGTLVSRPSFTDLACRLRDRVSSLAAFFGDGPIDMDFAGVAERTAHIQTRECRVAWERRSRRSSRTGDGFSGEAVYEGELGEWMPLLRLGEAVHVGKYAVWGNGWLRVEVV